MKILLVANTLPPADLSGVGEQVMQLSKSLEELGHEVRVLGRGPEGAPGPKLLFPLAVVVPFLRELARFEPDVVQIHESDGALAGLALRIGSSMRSGGPLLVALLQVSYWREFLSVRPIRHRGRVLGRPGWREQRFRWLKAPLQIALGWLTVFLSDRVLAPSAQTARELVEDYGAEDVVVVPNAIKPLAAEIEGATGRVQAGPFLFVGRLRIRKGVEVLLAAMQELPSDTRLVIVGDGEHRPRLEARVSTLGLEGRVEFSGRQPRDRVDELMDAASVLAVPSLYEGMPLVIVEAMQRGLAVVASAVSGIPEVVLDGETGWLVPCEDPPALARALAEALANPDETRRRGAAGRRRLEGRFSPQRVAQIWETGLGINESGKKRAE